MQLSEVLSQLAEDAPGEYSSAPPDDWRQGRTLYGGLTATLCAEASQRHVASPPELRALQITFVGPAAGRVVLRPQLLREGRSATFVGVDATAEAGTCARATLTYGARRESPIVHDRAPAPAVAGPEDCRPLDRDGGPAFLEHFELRFAAGALPFSGGEPQLAMWVRHRDPHPLDPSIALLSVADVLPPAASAVYREPRPMSSVTWSLELTRAPSPVEWYLMRSRSEHAADGYSVQTMGCWDRDGRCLALGRQTVALF